jgi:hypothetical protein
MSELPDNNRDEVRRWLSNVEDDLSALEVLLRDDIDGRYADDLRDASRTEAMRFADLARFVVASVRTTLLNG